MKKDIVISIFGEQAGDGAGGQVELITKGTYKNDNSGHYIIYDETEMTGFGGETTTTLKIEDAHKVVMTRSGGNNTRMVFEKGKHHFGHYETPYGGLNVGVFSENVRIDLNERGGSIKIDYFLDVNNSGSHKHNFSINFSQPS